MPPLAELAVRLLMAAILGGLVGIDRELRERSAGLRTHALVSTGSALFMLISAYGFTELGEHEEPGRLAAQVVSGIGFLGAGTIIFRKDAIRGLTTAASVWTVAGLGLACGLGHYALAAAATVVTLIILAGLRPLEERMGTKRRPVLRLKVVPSQVQVSSIMETLDRAGARVERLQVHHVNHDTYERVEVALVEQRGVHSSSYIDAVRAIPGVLEVTFNLERAPAPESPEATQQGVGQALEGHQNNG